MRLTLILITCLFVLTNTNAQIGTIEDYGTETKIKKQKEKEKLKPDYFEHILDNGFFLDGLIQYGTINVFHKSYPSFADISEGLGLGFRLGSKWYFGNMRNYRPGISAVWGRINLTLNNPLAGLYPVISLAPANIGFANAFSFGGELGFEVNINFGLNLSLNTQYSGLNVGYLVNPNIKFRYRSFAIGLDVTIMTSDNISSPNQQTNILLIGLTVGGKF